MDVEGFGSVGCAVADVELARLKPDALGLLDLFAGVGLLLGACHRECANSAEELLDAESI